MTHPQREREQGREVFFQRAVAAATPNVVRPF
jgi:hypothetical protein